MMIQEEQKEKTGKKKGLSQTHMLRFLVSCNGRSQRQMITSILGL